MRTLPLIAGIFLVAASVARADQTVADAQRSLKDQGFYYGEITGTRNDDTVAAIKRFQIRNGLQVTGDLNAETTKALRSQPQTSSSSNTHVAAATPAPVARQAPQPQVTEPGDSAPESAPPSNNAPVVPVTPRISGAGVFGGTPYEIAPAEVQRAVLGRAQLILARRGYYRGLVDGSFGPATEFGLRAFQSAVGLQPSGTLDMETLAAMRLLPGDRPARRILPFGPRAPVRGEWIRD